MPSHVYLFQNGDLYNIGWTDNIERTKNLFKPGQLLASLITNQPQAISERLKKNYQDFRLPGSDYFRLGRTQVAECMQSLEQIDAVKYYQPFFTGSRFIFAFISSWVLLTFLIVKFGIDPVLNRFT